MASTTTPEPNPPLPPALCTVVGATATPPPPAPVTTRRRGSTPPDGDVGTQEIRRQINEWKNNDLNINSSIDDQLFREEEESSEDAPQEESADEEDEDIIVEEGEDVTAKALRANPLPKNNEIDEDEMAFDPDDENREQMILRAVKHVKRARAQRKEYQKWVRIAQDHTERNVPHKDRVRCGVVDYGQNMQLPLYNQEQPGTSYYYSPLNVYNIRSLR